jgi:hypothetical protein
MARPEVRTAPAATGPVPRRVRSALLRPVDGNGAGTAPVRTGARPIAVRRVRPDSVARLAAFIAAVTAIAVWIAMFFLWLVASALGIVGGIERFAHDIGFTGFQVMSVSVVGATFLVTLAGIAMTTAVCTFVAVAYNWYADRIDRLEMEIDDATSDVGRG